MISQKFRQMWHDYYSEKRIVHQWLQVDLLHRVPGPPIDKVLEVGPYLGLVTAMLASAGYRVTTLDIENTSHGIGSEQHIQADIRAVDASKLQGFDAILCCETLEHIHWEKLDNVLRTLHGASAPWLIVSVPYEGFQFGLTLYLNRFVFRRKSFLRKFRFLKTLRIADHDDWEPHKWEVGYRGTGLRALVRKLEGVGFEIERRDFTAGCRSVFLLCRNRAAQDARAA